MNRKAVFLACTLSLALGACGGGSDTTPEPPPPNPLYVRASGDDLHNGADPSNALRSISRAAQLARSGYTIIVGAGTYRTEVNTARSGKAPAALTFVADVTGAQAGDRGEVIVDVTGVRGAAGFNLSNAPGSLIDGFTITGAADAGIVIKSRSDNFTIRNCVVHDSATGIRVQGSANVVVFNNLIYNNHGEGVAIVKGSPNASIINNTITRNSIRGITVGNSDQASPGPVIQNNILERNGGDSNVKVFGGSEDGFVGDYNLVVPDNTYIPDFLRRNHDVHDDAAFVGTNNFHLRPTSPAIDAGNSLNSMPQLRDFLRSRSTIGGGNLDLGPLDIGYHYLP